MSRLVLVVASVALAPALLLSGCKGDRNQCEQACRNFFTLTYREAADAEIAALPEDQRAAANRKKLAEFGSRIEGGVDVCIHQCVSANNDDQIACLTAAKTAAAARVCVE